MQTTHRLKTVKEKKNKKKIRIKITKELEQMEQKKAGVT